MVCPICITTAIVSQLPVISAAVVSATGVKLAIDQRRSSGANVKELKDAQKVTLMKVRFSRFASYLKCLFVLDNFGLYRVQETLRSWRSSSCV